MTPTYNTVGVVGAGAMGRGIAQIAAQAGSAVQLYDTQPEAVARRATTSSPVGPAAGKGPHGRAAVQACKQRLRPADTLQALADCDLVVEAVVERLDVKRALFGELEGIVAPGAVLATNTSSLSVTAIAAGLARPERFAGYHFFNPVPLMKVVEVVAGFKTEPAVCERPGRLRRADGPQRGAGAGHARLHRQPRRAAATAPRRCASSAKAWPTSPPSTAS